jgi:quercetin dioxygenase-like cupin family protein
VQRHKHPKIKGYSSRDDLFIAAEMCQSGEFLSMTTSSHPVALTPPAGIRAAQVIVQCTDLSATLDFFCDSLGFRVESIFPADEPSVAVIAGRGTRLRLRVVDQVVAPTAIHLVCPAAELERMRSIDAPNDIRIEWASEAPNLEIPPLPPDQAALVVSDDEAFGTWHVGRAGLHYRDLLPGRVGGRFVASHIRFPQGGTVADYVHYHHVRLQLIYCKTGWVRVVYEDQGPPFVLHAGDCVLQPPTIRHRVLEASQGMEVIELGSPAIHETVADHELILPTDKRAPDRRYLGQRFVHHEASQARWLAFRWPGYEQRDLGIAAATSQLATVCVIRRRRDHGTGEPQAEMHSGELLFWVVLAGELEVAAAGIPDRRLRVGSAATLAPHHHFSIVTSEDCEWLEVRLPG